MRLRVAFVAILGAFTIGALSALYFRPVKIHEKVTCYGSAFLCTTPYSKSAEAEVVKQLVDTMANAGWRRSGDLEKACGLCGMTVSGRTTTFINTNWLGETWLTYGRIEGQDTGVVDLHAFPPKSHHVCSNERLLFDARSAMLRTMANKSQEGIATNAANPQR